MTQEQKELYKDYENLLDEGLTTESQRYLAERDERDVPGFERGKAKGSWWHYVYAVIDEDVYLVKWFPTASAGDVYNWTRRRFPRGSFLITKYRDIEYARRSLLR